MKATNFPEWIEENKHLLKPPVGNKQMFPTGDDFITMVVGGPNQRTDFHVDPYEEFFYQIKGELRVNVMTDDGPATVEVNAGEMWVLPRNMPHSPQRGPDSIGLVIERVREQGTLEKFRWYCGECSAIVHEVELQVTDIVADLPPVFAAFYESEDARTCPECGALHPGKA
ncbi:3-hydroxyanthranilate 3,4-dioxygenase [Kribbella sandramycini]|uniref:3-hydroxyanthranilate 3,4-dioxygenase n=1 Tax=Kribbella sandramycini TaxID=60450 RepID=A0A7Y4L2S3_9ACTN|nr:3-hydroxyanthranilate 3,4-dioxygenase [Kribbella sandramycini]MBB6571353.1 3-hydroxyanthranilate 3,4-dioxygenase [Kribbella sandramycini]NOL43244.1 3-hydroxyanthranilate 3,4-dioxygenase [Kribbella sandramycini]